MRSLIPQENGYAEFHRATAPSRSRVNGVLRRNRAGKAFDDVRPAIEKTKSIRMNKYVGVLIASAFLLFSFTPSNSFDQVVGALRSGNASQLAKYFDSRVDITLPDLNDNFSKKQAEMILKDFFEKNEVRNFTIKHKGGNNGSHFCIGILQTRSRNFRTKVFMKRKGQQEVVQEIAFQEED